MNPKRVVLKQDTEDKLVLITSGPWKDHEGIIKHLEDGKLACLVLAHNTVKKGQVAVLDVIEIQEDTDWYEQKSVH